MNKNPQREPSCQTSILPGRAVELDRWPTSQSQWLRCQLSFLLNRITIEAMTQAPAADELLFEALTPLGFRVRVTRAYWEVIITVKHPVMTGRENDLIDTLQNPGEIRQSKSDRAVYLFYKPERMGRWVCAVTKRLDGNGFLITAYPTDAIKEGELVWPK